MNEEEYTPQGSTFEGFILSKWAELFELSEKFRKNFMLGVNDLELNNDFFSKLTRIWGALRPKVEGRADMKDIETKFMEFERYYYNPSLLGMEENSEDIFKLESTIEIVLDKLLVTTFR